MPIRLKIYFAANRLADELIELRRQLTREILEEVKRRLEEVS